MINPNLIIVDDHTMFLEGLRFILESQQKYKIVCTAKSGNHVIKYLEINGDHAVDLVITDISMPDMNGIQLNSNIKNRYPKVRTLVISMHNDEGMIHKLIENGVDGYITKDDTTNNKLFEAIDTILSGTSYFSEKIWKTYKHSKAKKDKETLANLSEMEKEILRLITLEHTTQEIANIVNRSKLTIDSYRKNLLSKVGSRNSVGLAIWAIRVGLVDIE